jgi:CheY-like chemotaxis protein
VAQTRILVVEDNLDNIKLISDWLTAMDYEVLKANDGNEAISVATAEKPDVILMDLSLPAMDGWEATRQLKANNETQQIPIIALTAHAMTGDRKQALDAGCDDYVTKPIDFPTLIRKLKKYRPDT